MEKSLTTNMVVIAVIALILGGAIGYVAHVPPEATDVPEPIIPELLTDPNTLIFGTDFSESVSLDPARAYEFWSCQITHCLYDTLVTFEQGDVTEIYPELAESWEVSEDGLVWTFYLRQGLSFPSGTPVDAEAVAFSFNRACKLEQSAGWILTQFGMTDGSTVALDDYTVQLTLDRKYTPFLFLSCLAFTTASVVDPVVVMEYEQDGDMGGSWMTDHSAGNGPYVLEKWDRGTEVVLRANENYWKGVPSLKTILVKQIAEPADQRMMLERGDIDIAWDLPADMIDDLKGTKGIEIIEQPVFTQDYIGMNVGVEPLGDERVRDAIRWSIDYEGIVNEIMKGAAIKLQTFIPTGMLGYNPATPYYQNPKKAKELLAEAGYPGGFDIELAHAAAPQSRDIAAKIKSDLAKSDIRVTLAEMTSAMMYEKYRAQGLQLVLGGWGADYADPDGMAKPFADGTIKQLSWRNMYYDEYATNLTREAMIEMDTAKRIEIYAELTDYILDHGCFAILYQDVHQVALKTWVEGFYKCPLFALENFEEYYKETIYVLP